MSSLMSRWQLIIAQLLCLSVCSACTGGKPTLLNDEQITANAAREVRVECAPLAMHKNYFGVRDLLPSVEKDPNFEAYTLWFFHCFADFQLEDQEFDDTAGASTLRVKVKGVQMRLSCPINIWMEKKASALTRAHEDGHVYICRKVYEMAPAAARLAGGSVLGKSYNGMGANLSQARKMALQQAEADVAAVFQAKIVDLCDEISQLYDDQCRQAISNQSETSQQTMAEHSFKQIVGSRVFIY